MALKLFDVCNLDKSFADLYLYTFVLLWFQSTWRKHSSTWSELNDAPMASESAAFFRPNQHQGAIKRFDNQVTHEE
jgi:hypothetical protein